MDVELWSPYYLYAIVPLGALSTIYLIRKIRECQWGWVHADYPLQGKIYIITGANTGLGYETTKALVKRGATVVMGCRSVEKGNAAIAKIRRETTNGQLVNTFFFNFFFNNHSDFSYIFLFQRRFIK